MSIQCGQCGNEVRLLSGPGRTYCLVYGVPSPIPDDFEIPTCIQCGNEYMTLKISEELIETIKSNRTNTWKNIQ